MATSAAMPKIIADMNNRRRERLRRLSRQAISKSQGMFIFLLVYSIASLSIICLIVSNQFAAFYAEDALGFRREVKVVRNQNQRCAGFFIQIEYQFYNFFAGFGIEVTSRLIGK